MKELSKTRFGDYFFRFATLGFVIENPSEEWIFKEEPHIQRRLQILKKYPEVKKLMGYDTSLAWFVLLEVFVQIIACWLVSSYFSWINLVIASYIISATLNHSLGAAIHEIGHNLAFGHRYPNRNRFLGMLANLPIGVPMSVTYKKYHADHHRYMGHQTLDVDIPSVIESYLFRNPCTKIIWLLCHPIIHAIRPYCKSPLPLWRMEIVNFIVQFIFDGIIFYFFGVKGLAYFLLGTLLGMGGLHPLSGHFISEHYLFTDSQATHSYYGPLNYLMYNLGYHNEHHDFPYIPFRNLPLLKKMAPEFYDDIAFHTSWVKVIWDFIFDDHMGPHARGVGYLPEGKSEEDIALKRTGLQKVE